MCIWKVMRLEPINSNNSQLRGRRWLVRPQQRRATTRPATLNKRVTTSSTLRLKLRATTGGSTVTVKAGHRSVEIQFSVHLVWGGLFSLHLNNYVIWYGNTIWQHCAWGLMHINSKGWCMYTSRKIYNLELTGLPLDKQYGHILFFQPPWISKPWW